MEKLIKLLSRYGKDDDWCLVRVEGNVRKIDEMLIISKQYGFIKWLVDNNKIELPTSCAIDKNNNYTEREIKSDYESLLMLLAIQDEPIEFLISLLK